MYKIWIHKVFNFIVFLMLFVGIFNYIVDPFVQYHKPLFYKKIFINEEQRYINAGLIKNYEFDSALIGSSMIENFTLEGMKESLLFDEPIKLCLNGGSAYEHKIILENTLDNKSIKNILIGLDYFAYEGNIENVDKRGTLPLYLYDNNIFNDYQYIFSIDTLKKSIEVILRSFINTNDPRSDLNNMYSWQHLFSKKDFNKNNTLRSYCESTKNTTQYVLKDFIDSFKHNTLSVIKKNQKTKFTVIFPPYSILQYKRMEKNNNFETYMKFKKRIMELLIKESNVQIFDFQIAKNIILDLSNYRDIQHYHSQINSWMLKEIYNNNYLVTRNTLDEFIRELENIVYTYTLLEGYECDEFN